MKRLRRRVNILAFSVRAPATTRFTYDGLDPIAEYDGSNLVMRRYVHGPGIDQPVVWYEGTGTTNRRFLHSDERGSIIAVTDAGGSLSAANRYDEYGVPGSGNLGRFQYTGQMWLPELGLHYYKNRMHSSTLGRFLQTDPIGYGDGANLYAYVRNDPVNFVDPLGLRTPSPDPLTLDPCFIPVEGCEIVVTGSTSNSFSISGSDISNIVPLSWTVARASGIDRIRAGGPRSYGQGGGTQASEELSESSPARTLCAAVLTAGVVYVAPELLVLGSKTAQAGFLGTLSHSMTPKAVASNTVMWKLALVAGAAVIIGDLRLNGMVSREISKRTGMC